MRTPFGRVRSGVFQSLLRCFATLCLTWAAGTAQAAGPACAVTMSDLAFGAIDPLTGSATTSGTLNYQCSYTAGLVPVTAQFKLCASAGLGVQGLLSGTRVMARATGSPALLQYQLYLDGAFAQPWGSRLLALGLGATANAAFQMNVPSNGTATVNGSIPIYGRILPGQTTTPTGNYLEVYAVLGLDAFFDYQASTLGPPLTCSAGGTGGAVLQPISFRIAGTVPPQCTIASATDMAFGALGGNGASPNDQTSVITLSCTRETAWQIAIGPGNHADSGTRRMAHQTLPGNYLAYGLYQNAIRSVPWGDTAGSNTVQGSGLGNVNNTVTVYGRVPAQPTALAGSYSDTVLVTVTY